MKQNILHLLMLLLVNGTLAAQQLPNSGFENWSTDSTKNPVGWSSLNWTSHMYGAPYTCTKTSEASAGSTALKLETIIYGGQTIDAFAFTGTWPDPLKDPRFGYAYTKRPAKLKGYYKFSSLAGDSCLVIVFLTRWNPGLKKQDSIGRGFFYGKKASAYTLFEATIEYYQTGLPDTASVLLLASSVTSSTTRGIPGNVLFIDDLAFEFPSGLHESLFPDVLIQAYPNPFRDEFRVMLPGGSYVASVMIYDQYRRMIISQILDEADPQVDLSSQPDGVYMLEVRINDTSHFMRIIKS